MKEKVSRLQTHKDKIDRYRKLLCELRFVEQRLLKERAMLATLQSISQSSLAREIRPSHLTWQH